MLTRTFTYCQHEDFGHMGLKPNWMPNGDPFDGLGCAHDMLEHFATQTSPLEGECEAIGAHLYLRLQNGYHISRQRGPRELWKQLRDQLGSCMKDFMYDDLRAPTVVPTRPLDADTEAALQRALDDAVAYAVSEFDPRDEALNARYDMPAFRAGMEAWVRRGYRKAVRRYARHDTFDISEHLFDRVASKLDYLMEHFLKDGAQVGVSLDLGALAVHVRVNGERIPDDYFC